MTMPTRILPATVRFVLVLASLANFGVTSCHYYNITIWSGKCSPTTVTYDREHTYLNLSCPGVTDADHPPATKQHDVVVLFQSNSLPQSIQCDIARSGGAECEATDIHAAEKH